jgi:hypothetical protein
LPITNSEAIEKIMNVKLRLDFSSLVMIGFTLGFFFLSQPPFSPSFVMTMLFSTAAIKKKKL